jgi:pimeloyl-ACP methyl ester carboxylesterase
VVAIAPAGGWKRYSPTQLLVGLKFLLIAPAAFLGRAIGDLARQLPARLLRPLLKIVSSKPERMSRAQRHAFVRATTHCSAFLPYFWSDLRRGGVSDLAEIDVPVRLVLCEDDWLLPPERHGAVFRDQLRGADVVELPDVGHVPMYDDPAAVARVIREHLAAHAEDRSERSA